MAEYHVGCGLAGIYAGTLKTNGEEWRNKTDATHEALYAVAQFLITHVGEKTHGFNREDDSPPLYSCR